MDKIFDVHCIHVQNPDCVCYVSVCVTPALLSLMRVFQSDEPVLPGGQRSEVVSEQIR